ncbi:MAG: hypothetical protein PSX71_08810 [bacterium]|nr:hypothetical protein [bacterium]
MKKLLLLSIALILAAPAVEARSFGGGSSSGHFSSSSFSSGSSRFSGGSSGYQRQAPAYSSRPSYTAPSYSRPAPVIHNTTTVVHSGGGSGIGGNLMSGALGYMIGSSMNHGGGQGYATAPAGIAPGPVSYGDAAPAGSYAAPAVVERQSSFWPILDALILASLITFIAWLFIRRNAERPTCIGGIPYYPQPGSLQLNDVQRRSTIRDDARLIFEMTEQAYVTGDFASLADVVSHDVRMNAAAQRASDPTPPVSVEIKSHILFAKISKDGVTTVEHDAILIHAFADGLQEINHVREHRHYELAASGHYRLIGIQPA